VAVDPQLRELGFVARSDLNRRLRLTDGCIWAANAPFLSLQAGIGLRLVR